MLSPSLMFQEALGGHGVLGPPKGHEVQGGPVRGDKTSGALELSLPIWPPPYSLITSSHKSWDLPKVQGPLSFQEALALHLQ